MELFEQIRREYEHGGTIRGIAKKLGIHRRMVREAVLSAVPAERKTPLRERPKLEPAKAFVEAILEADRKAPRKQRHTAHRIWCRIRAEMPGVQICESTIRGYVRERKIELRLVGQEVFVPQSYRWGQEAQVDWYEAYADMTFGSCSKGTCAAAMLGRAPTDNPAAKTTTIHLISFISVSSLSRNVYPFWKGTSSGRRMVRLICNTSAFCDEPMVLNGGLKRRSPTCGLEYRCAET